MKDSRKLKVFLPTGDRDSSCCECGRAELDAQFVRHVAERVRDLACSGRADGLQILRGIEEDLR